MKRNNGTNTCLTDSVAYISNIPSNKVPFFIGRKRWFKSLSRWANKYGRTVKWIKYENARARKLEQTKKLYIAIGQSPRSKAKNPKDARAVRHAVVKRGNKYVYDPSGRKPMLKGKPLFYIEFITKRKYETKRIKSSLRA